MTPTLSIIILSYRNPALLRLCLKSLARALRNTSLTYEVIVVDNATVLETRSVVREEFQNEFSAIHLIPIAENAGYTRGNMIGARAAKGEYILMLNQDIVVPEKSIESLVSYLAAHPEIGIIGPELLNFNGTHQDSYFRLYSPLTVLYRRIDHLPFARQILNRFLMRESDTSQIQTPDWISGAAFMTSRSAIKRVGFMDESLFHYFSDVDWCRRFWENGYHVAYYPEAKLYHYLGRSSKSGLWFMDLLTNRTTWWHIQDAIRYFWKYRFSSKVNHQLSHATAH